MRAELVDFGEVRVPIKAGAATLDLAALAGRLGERLGEPRAAVQPGRHIATLAASAALGKAGLGNGELGGLTGGGLDCLTAEPELALIRRLAGWPRTVEAAALASEPHRIAFFLYDLAGDFHMLWNRGQADTTLRFLQPALPGETLARLALVAATAVVIRSGLAVMGVVPVEEMR